MRGPALLIAIVVLMALAGYVVRSSSKQASNILYALAAILGTLLAIGLTRLG